MTQVKVRYHDIIARTDAGTLFLFSEKEAWVPNRYFRYSEGRNIVMPLWLADKKGLRYRPLLHIPETMTPVVNQSPIDELRYDPERGD
jgi:hypothetical protein